MKSRSKSKLNNKTGLAIIRVSSRQQKDNLSHEVQEKEIREYCTCKGIELVDVIKIIESAKNSEDRIKYKAAIDRARKQGLYNLIFYMYDREARNLTDTEVNEKYARGGIFAIHYVRENQILDENSTESDYMMRDFQAVNNKGFSRRLSAKIVDVQNFKAEDGWYPGNRPPLGYAHIKRKDDEGRELKRGTTIGPDPIDRKVRQVQREYELRAEGLSYPQIHRRMIDEGMISAAKIKSYFLSSIEKRLKNKFYRGKFDWDGVEFQGKHPLIIPKHILDAVDKTFGDKRPIRQIQDDHGILGGGWLKCAECGCNVVYDPKIKIIKDTGERRQYHYYHCTNGKKSHKAPIVTVSEEKIWTGLEQAIEAVSISEGFAKDIADALNETHKNAGEARKREMEGFRAGLSELESREDEVYVDFRKGILDEIGYKRQIQRVREERSRFTRLLEAANNGIDDAYLETAKSILELATNAKLLWKSRSPTERKERLSAILSNQVLDGLNVRYEMKKPFVVLSQMASVENWRPLVEDFRTAVIHFRAA